MQRTGVPPAVSMQNVAAAAVGAAIAVYGARRSVSSAGGLAVIGVALLLLVASLLTGGVEGVHRWLRIGPLGMHAAYLVIPLVLVELDRILGRGRLAVALCVMFVIAAILAMQPDASQATAFAASSIVLLAVHRRRSVPAVAGMLALAALAALSFLKEEPLAPVPHVEEIAIRIAQQGAAWQVLVIVVLALLLAPFLASSTSAGVAVAIYVALVTAASWWGNFPVPVLGHGMSPILGYLAAWTWLRATSRSSFIDS